MKFTAYVLGTNPLLHFRVTYVETIMHVHLAQFHQQVKAPNKTKFCVSCRISTTVGLSI